jgi:hypothetical protein
MTLISADTNFEISFRPEEVNNRVLARNIVRVFLPDGTIGEFTGLIKGEDGYAGLSGKIIKQGDKNIGGKILGGIARVGGRMIGQTGSIGSEVESEMDGTGITNDGDPSIARSNRIIEISRGTRFYLFVGTPD